MQKIIDNTKIKGRRSSTSQNRKAVIVNALPYLSITSNITIEQKYLESGLT